MRQVIQVIHKSILMVGSYLKVNLLPLTVEPDRPGFQLLGCTDLFRSELRNEPETAVSPDLQPRVLTQRRIRTLTQNVGDKLLI